MKRVLAAIDGSEASYRALEHAAKLANGLGAELKILIVRQFVVGRRHVLDVLNDEQVQEIKRFALGIVEGAGLPGAEIIEQTSRDVAYTIVEVAIKNDCELIVMGASGMRSIEAFLLGSVSKEVLKKSPCPVTIVH